MTWLIKCVDNATGYCLSLFFVIPVLRSLVDLPIGVYFVASGFLSTVAILNFGLRRVRRVGGYISVFLILNTALVGWLLLSGLWSSVHTMLWHDTVLLIGVFTLSLSVTFALNKRALNAMITGLGAIGISVSTYVFYTYIVAGDMRGYNVDIHALYLSVSMAIGVSVVGVALFALSQQKSPWWTWLVVPYMFVGLSLSLARGALLSALIIVLAGGILKLFRQRIVRSTISGYIRSIGKRTFGISLIGGLVAGVMGVAMSVERTSRRLLRMFDGAGSIFDTRTEIWAAAWDRIVQAPWIGHGLGGYRIMDVTESYPHNMLLQVWMDGGVVSLVLLISIVVMPFLLVTFSKNKSRIDGLVMASLGMYTFIMLEFMKSFDFYTGRNYFVMAVIVVVAMARLQGRKVALSHTERS